MCFFRKRLRQLLWLQTEVAWRMNQQLEEKVSANTDAINEVVEQLKKARAEIVIRIDSLQKAVDRGDDIVGPLGDLRKIAQELDDVIADDEGGPVLETNGPATPDTYVEPAVPEDNVSEEEAQVVTDDTGQKADQKGKNLVQPEDDPNGEINKLEAAKRAVK